MVEVDILIKKRGYMQPSNPFIVDNSVQRGRDFDTSKTGAISRAVWILLQAFLRSVHFLRSTQSGRN